MTIIKKLTDRDSFIYEVIGVLLVNIGNMDQKKLQFELLKCGIYIKKPLLTEALKIMREKGLISKPDEKPKINIPKIIV